MGSDVSVIRRSLGISIDASPSFGPPTFPSPISKSHLANCFISSASDAELPTVNLMFFVNLINLHVFHR
ncbi:hypothetical protein Hanom_Chr15g01367201 [Helianthus anomalus]